jgi:membrane-bound serine protease (ClpP class)
VAGVAAAPTSAAAPALPPHVDVIQVSGLLDPVLVDFIDGAVRRAERGKAEALVVQLNSTGAVVSKQAIDDLASRLGRAEVPVGVWVGPSGARAVGGAAALLAAAPILAAAPNARVGAGRGVNGRRAVASGLLDFTAPTLRDFVLGMDGRQASGRTVDTTKTVATKDGPRPQATVQVAFAKPALVPRLLHTAASPSVAYLLLVVALLLIAFEFFTAGVGVAAVCGAACLILGCYGLAVLPTRPIGLVLVAVGVLGYAIDLQAGAPRAWTVIGSGALVLGALNFYRGLSVGLLPLFVGVVGAALFMVPGMASMVRARFSTPTIGRESMIGEEGVAATGMDPEGTVSVREVLWRARTNRATPIAAGDRVRVAAISGVLLEVEPLPTARES